MPFILSSSEWSQEQWEYADGPQFFAQHRLLEAIESLHENRSFLMHPRAGLDDLAGHELVVYRSGRIEWCPTCSYDGYDPESRYLWATNDKAIELWLKLLHGDTDAIAREPWQNGYVTFCPVCGYDLGFPPWGNTGNTPYFDICPCCGTEFGLQDRSWAAVGRLREIWITNRHPWFNPARKHADWLPEQQLLNLPTDLMRSRPFD